MLHPLLFLAALLMGVLHGAAQPGLLQQAGTPEAAQVSIASPSTRQVLQGLVTISGSAAVEGFQAAELEFAYSGEKDPTWFYLGEIDQPVQAGALLEWDTTTISDGDYTLRLVVKLKKGDPLEARVTGLRVRNYSPVETDTPTLSPMSPTTTAAPLLEETPAPAPTSAPLPQAAAAGLPTPRPTPTGLPANPAWMPAGSVTASLGLGVLATAGIFLLVAMYQILKGIVRSFFQNGE